MRLSGVFLTAGAVFLTSLGLLACTNSEISRFYPPAELPVTQIDIQGSYCVTRPESLIFPVKILFILDDSGSMSWSDPAFRRLAAARELVDTLIVEEEIYFGVIKFQDGQPILMTDNPVFWRDPGRLHEVLEDGLHQPVGATPYVGALSTALTAIGRDIDADPLMAGRTRYVVLFLSDGEPTDEDYPPGPAPEYARIKSTARQLKELEKANPGVGELTLHTAYLQAENEPNLVAIDLLQELAHIGDGQFKNFENGEAIDFKEFDVSAISRDYKAYFPILITNLTARLEAGGLVADSDADGLTDREEERIGTDPTAYDTDGDGCGDLMEVRYAEWDPLVPGWETQPMHCDCDEAERHADSDGDGLTDCEEIWLSLNPNDPDSDLTVDGKPAPDYMLDSLEVSWNLGRTKHDSADDYDFDGASNLLELGAHTNPHRNDGALRDEYAYEYEYINQQAADPYCYDFRVTNVHLVKTLAAAGRAAGENLFLMYYVEAPQDNPFKESMFKVVRTTVSFNGQRPIPAILEARPERFHQMGAPGGSGNQPPTADAGEDKTFEDTDGDGQVLVELDGSCSSDPEGRLESYRWFEDGREFACGASVTVSLSVGEHALELLVMDDLGATGRDTVLVTITSPVEVPDAGEQVSSVNAGGCQSASGACSSCWIWILSGWLAGFSRRRLRASTPRRPWR